MTRKKAISILKKQKEKLFAINVYDDFYLWQQSSLDYITSFLGKDANAYSLIKSFKFPDMQEQKFDENIKVLKTKISECLNLAIENVENLGLKTKYHNRLCRYSDKELLAFAATSIVAIFTAGLFIGKWFFSNYQA